MPTPHSLSLAVSLMKITRLLLTAVICLLYFQFTDFSITRAAALKQRGEFLIVEAMETRSPAILVGGRPYGRFTNNLLSVLHVLDLCHITNVTKIVATKWANDALTLLMGEDYNVSTELGIHHRHHHDRRHRRDNEHYYILIEGEASFWLRAENRLRLQLYNRPLRQDGMLVVGQYFHTKNHSEATLPMLAFSTDRARRQRYLQILKEKLQYPPPAFHNTTYAAIHVRSMEGSCERRSKSNVATGECSWDPDYVRQILKPYSPNNMSIHVIWDKQNETIISNLKASFGDRLHMSDPSNTVVQDMVLAMHSTVFMGTRASTIAGVIGQFRELASNKSGSTNYIHTQGQNEDGSWITCGSCIYFAR